MELREYQSQIIEELLEKLKNKDKTIITLGMGGGKSVLISEISKIYSKLNKKIVILLNISELVPQIKEHLDVYGLKYSVIKSKEDIKSDSNITIVMEQSFHENKRLEEEVECDILLKDEFHIGYGGKRYEDIIEHLKPKKIIGLSGTPYDEKGFLLKGFELEDLITYGSTYELTQKGYLTPLKYYVPKWSVNIDYSNVKSTNDYITSELDKKINTIKHTKMIIESMNQMKGKEKKTLVYCNSIEHANRVNEYLKKEGYKTACVHSLNGEEENKEIIKRFRKEKDEVEAINCLVSISKLTTGFNEPKAELLVLCRPTKVLRLYLQILFRVARLNKDKKYAEILDLGQCVNRHGFGDRQQLFISSNNLNQKQLRERTIQANVTNTLTLEAIKEILKEEEKIKELTKEEIVLKIKELRIKNVDIEKTRTNDLFIIFENSWDIELIIGIKYELFRRMKNINYEKEEIYYEIESCNLELEEKSIKERNEYLKKKKQEIKKEIKETKNVKR